MECGGRDTEAKYVLLLCAIKYELALNTKLHKGRNERRYFTQKGHYILKLTLAAGQDSAIQELFYVPQLFVIGTRYIMTLCKLVVGTAIPTEQYGDCKKI